MKIQVKEALMKLHLFLSSFSRTFSKSFQKKNCSDEQQKMNSNIFSERQYFLFVVSELDSYFVNEMNIFLSKNIYLMGNVTVTTEDSSTI